MLDNEKRFSPHRSHGMDVAKMLAWVLAINAFLRLIPWARYFAWIIPFLFFLWEKESDFAEYMLAQSTVLSFLYALAALFLQLPVGYLCNWLSVSLSYPVQLLGELLSTVSNVLLAVLTMGTLILELVTVARARDYIQCRVLFFGNWGQKMTKRFKQQWKNNQ